MTDELLPLPDEPGEDYVLRLGDVLDKLAAQRDPTDDLRREWAAEYAHLVVTDALTLDQLTPQQRARRAELLDILAADNPDS